MPTKRWPATNTDALVRHVARQFPEVTRRQVAGVLNLAFQAIADSLGAQAESGDPRPSVKVRNFGSFELRWHKASKKHHINGTMRVVPPRWKTAFRPSQIVEAKVGRASEVTRTKRKEGAKETAPTDPCLDSSHEEGSALPNVRAGSEAADRRD